MLTEDYYVANKLMKGFLGSANVDTNSRLCMASTVAGHRRAFGADMVPGSYEDLDQADLLVLVGSNAAWCHPVLFQRMMRNRRERGAKIVVIDPRRTATGRRRRSVPADRAGHRHRAVLRAAGASRRQSARSTDAYIEAHTDRLRRRAGARPRDRAGRRRDRRRDRPRRRRRRALLRAVPRTTQARVTCFSQGVNQSAQGTDKVNAIINCHLATGRIGQPGMGPFSLTGQPNAMGGREVGGLANQLAAHMGFAPAEVDRVRRFWNAPRMAEREGLKAVQMFEAIERGEIKALWVMATNPAVSLPRAGAMREALKKLELFVVSENVLRNDTVSAAPHVLLPAAAWGEKDGTVTNSERRISRQRAFLPLPGDAQARLVDRHARSRGISALATHSPIAAPPTSFASMPRCRRSRTTARATSISAASRRSPTRTTTRSSRCNGRCAPSDGAGSARLFADGGFSTPDRKARFVAPEPPALREATSAEFPLRLNTGRLRDQWHTMTRTGQSPRLGAHRPEPFVEVHPLDAKALRPRRTTASPASAAAHGACVLKVVTSAGQQRGSLFAPIHWSDANASSARIGDLVAPHDRSVLRPARSQGDAGRDRAGRLRLSRLCAVARAARAAGRHLVGARRAAGRRRHACSPATTRRSPGATSRRTCFPTRC